MKNSDYYAPGENGKLKVEKRIEDNEREMRFFYRLVFVTFIAFLIIGVLFIIL